MKLVVKTYAHEPPSLEIIPDTEYEASVLRRYWKTGKLTKLSALEEQLAGLQNAGMAWLQREVDAAVAQRTRECVELISGLGVDPGLGPCGSSEYSAAAIRSRWPEAFPGVSPEQRRGYETVDGEPCDGDGRIFPEIP